MRLRGTVAFSYGIHTVYDFELILGNTMGKFLWREGGRWAGVVVQPASDSHSRATGQPF